MAEEVGIESQEVSAVRMEVARIKGMPLKKIARDMRKQFVEKFIAEYKDASPASRAIAGMEVQKAASFVLTHNGECIVDTKKIEEKNGISYTRQTTTTKTPPISIEIGGKPISFRLEHKPNSETNILFVTGFREQDYPLFLISTNASNKNYVNRWDGNPANLEQILYLAKIIKTINDQTPRRAAPHHDSVTSVRNFPVISFLNGLAKNEGMVENSTK